MEMGHGLGCALPLIGFEVRVAASPMLSGKFFHRALLIAAIPMMEKEIVAVVVVKLMLI